MRPLRARVDLGAIAMKGYSAFPKAPVLLEPHQDTRWEEELTPLQRSSRCILQPQPTGHLYMIKVYIYIYISNHHVVPLARISLTLSRYFSLSFIAFGRSSGLHPVSLHSCCMYVRAGSPAFAWPYAGVHRSTSLMSSSLLLQQCPACLVRLTCIVFVMVGKWPYSLCLVGCCRQDLFNIALNILV